MLFIISVAFIAFLPSIVRADISYNGFSFTECDKSRKDAFIENTHMSITKKAEGVGQIWGIDVNKVGRLVICFNNGSIDVYDIDDAFLFGVRFNARGEHVIASWHGDSLGIYFVRSGVLLVCDEAGNPVSMYEISGEESDYIRSNEKQQVNYMTTRYELRRVGFDFLTGAYSQIVRVRADTEEVLYDVAWSANITIIFLMFVMVCIFWLVWRNVKHSK